MDKPEAKLFLHGEPHAHKRFWEAVHWAQDRSPERLCLVTMSWPVVQSDPSSDTGIRTEHETMVRTLALAAGLEVREDSVQLNREHVLAQVMEGFGLLNEVRQCALELFDLHHPRPDRAERIYNKLNAAGNSLGYVLDQAKWFVEGKRE